MINPLIQLTAGVLGIVGGGTLMMLGIFLMVKETQAYQETAGAVKQGAALAAAPETGGASLAATQSAGQSAQAKGQQYELDKRRRQAARDAAKQMSTQDLLRQEAARYGKGVPA